MLIKNTRNLVIDIYDYNNNKMVNLYDNSANVEGQAFDVCIKSERNGWEELSLSIPSMIQTADGKEKNYRLDYLVSDYKIRCLTDDDIKWFIISEDKITHSKMATNISIVAGSTSQLLKTKNLGLEFSDDEGNNIGTAEQILETIIKDTGWSVGEVTPFLEDDGTVKVRSLKASAKTGAFSLISKMCDLFEAKPVYHTNERTIDIIPMNPFAEPADGSLPEAVEYNRVIELCYPTNIKSITRTQDTSNLITKLFAYGSYGDVDLGYCGLENLEHVEHYLTFDNDLTANTTYNFTLTDSTGTEMKRHFTPTCNIISGSALIWSELDMASMMYLYDTTNSCAYFIEDSFDPEAGEEITVSDETNSAKNWFSFIMDFNYYKKIGLFTNDMLQELADFQRNSPALYENVSEKAEAYNEQYSNLAATIGVLDYCKLNVGTIEQPASGYLKIHLNATTAYPKGIIYRTDYDKIERNQFKWRIATQLKGNGDPINEGASIVYAIRTNNGITTWNKFYLKEISEDQLTLTTWIPAQSGLLNNSDQIYLFSQNSVSGNLGAYEVFEETNAASIDEQTKVVTVKHPVYFTRTPNQPGFDFTGYAWNYRYNKDGQEELYFCDKNGYEADNFRWARVYVSIKNDIPYAANSYFYNMVENKLYRGINGSWKELEDNSQNSRMFSAFGSVIYACLERDSIYDTTYENYIYTIGSSGLAKNNYYFYDEYGKYKLFSTSQNLSSSTNDKLTYQSSEMVVIETHNGADTSLEVKHVQVTSVDYLPDNFLNTGKSISFLKQDLDNNGELMPIGTGSAGARTSSYIELYPNLSYRFISNETSVPNYNIYLYDGELNFLQKIILQTSGLTFNSGNAKYIRFKLTKLGGGEPSIANFGINALNANNAIVVNDEAYYYLSSFNSMTHSGAERSIIKCVEKFREYSDDVYGTLYSALKTAQDAVKQKETDLINVLHDLYREGYWQKSDYVEGDEKKLYKDAMDNLKEVSKPNTKYNISFLDLYGAIRDNYPNDSIDELSSLFGQAIFDRSKFDYTNPNFYIEWPDVTINYAVHLIDDDLNINTWAFIDKINKCYDQPWKTTLEVNTNLSTIGQHTFTDVLTNIAEVANQLKVKESKYDKAAITNGGQLAAERLEGKIDANKLMFSGGCSTWYTDDRGNIVFESGDGKSAMTLTGNGFCISNSKDEFGDWNWRTMYYGSLRSNAKKIKLIELLENP